MMMHNWYKDTRHGRTKQHNLIIRLHSYKDLDENFIESVLKCSKSEKL